MKCMKYDDYNNLLELVRIQSSTYQNMKSDGSISGKYYEDTYVLLNVGNEALCNVDFMLVLPPTNMNNNEVRTKLSGLPPGASPKENIKKSELPYPAKNNNDKSPMNIYTMEGVEMKMETNPHAIYPKVTGKRHKSGDRNLVTENDSNTKSKEEEKQEPWIISGSLPDLYLAPNDADMFGFTLFSKDENAPILLQELCIVSYQTCTIDSMNNEQKEQKEDVMRMDQNRLANMEEHKRTNHHPRRTQTSIETGERRGGMYGPGGSHAVRKVQQDQYRSRKRPKWHYGGWMTPEQIKLGVHPIPVNHGNRNSKKKMNPRMNPLFNERYPVNTNFRQMDNEMDKTDVINWGLAKFDVVVLDHPGDLETEMNWYPPFFYSSRLAFPRVEEEESSETEDYLALPREEEEESSETEDYLALPREEEEESSETEDYLALPREEEEESSETEDYLALPGEDHGPGGDHAVRKKTRFLRSLSPTGLDAYNTFLP